MAIARIAVRAHSRRRGHSAAAAWAYRSGRCFTCARTGKVHDYRPRARRSDDIVETGLAWTGEVEGTPALARDEQQLLDAIEHAERRRDAKILRDIQLALPAGLGTETLVELVREYAQWVADEYHTLAMWAIHRPGRIGDGRNIHAHVLVPTRELEASGAAFGRKLRVLDDFKSGPAEICRLRNQWCESANARLERAGMGTRIHAGRRLDAPPMPTIPERFVVREYAAKRAAGLATEPMRVAELAELGDPENRAMARIAAHGEAGYDVPASERVYEEKARPYYERAREHDATDRDAAHYAGLSIVREELEAAHTELAELEARMQALGAANAPGPLAPEPLVFVPARSVEAPPALEDDDGAREPALVPRPLAALDAGDESALPEPLLVASARSVEAPPALEDDDGAREPALVPRPLAVLDAGDESALPEPLLVASARLVEAPPALEDDDWAHEPALVPQPLAALDAGDESAFPDPLLVASARSVEAPPALEDDDGAREPALVPRLLAALDAVDESALPEPLLVVPARPVEEPPALEDDDGAREPALVPRPLAVLDAGDESALPEPLLVASARSVEAPPALEDDDGAGEPALVPQPLAALDAGDESALPEPLLVASARSVEAPPALEDDDGAGEPALVSRPLAVLDAGDESALPEPLLVASARLVEAPPALEDDDGAREPALAPQPLAVLDAGDESALPEPLLVASARLVEAPPALEDDDGAHEPALVPQPLAALDAGDESALPEPLLVASARSVEAPPALEDDDRAREPALVPRLLAALDAVDESTLPEPLLFVPARSVEAPPALEDDDEALERELENLVEDVERMHDTLEPIETKVARELSVPDWLAATIEESMRREVRDAPQWEPRLADIPRSTETSKFGVVVWRMVLFAEMEELRECGNDRKRIERHIANVRERAKTDAPWRSQIIATIAGSISPRYLADLARAGYFDPEPTRDEAKDALLLRLRRQGAGGGLDAWSEQSVARAAGLEVDFSFGQWSRARESGLLAEDVLRLHLHDAVRAARRLKRIFPGESRPGPGGPTTLLDWHRGLAGVVSDVRERLRDPKTRDGLMTDLAMRMVPDLRAEWARGGEGAGRGPMPEAPAAPAERDRALRELARQRARNAGIEDNLDNADRTRLRGELDVRLERMLEEICRDGVDVSLAIGALAPDGVPESGETAGALARVFAQRFEPGLKRIRDVKGTGREHEERMRVLEGCRKVVTDATKRRRVVDALVAAAGAHYEAEWLPRLESADPRGVREREALRAELEAQVLAGVEAAGEAQILSYAGIGIEYSLPYGVGELSGLLDDGGFVDGITHRRPEREPVRSAVERWRGHCETHLGDIASMLLEATWPEHWERYRKTRRRGEPERVPTRDERDEAVLDATPPAAPTRRRHRDQGPDHGLG